MLEHGMPLRSAPTYHPLAIEPPRFVKYLPASNRLSLRSTCYSPYFARDRVRDLCFCLWRERRNYSRGDWKESLVEEGGTSFKNWPREPRNRLEDECFDIYYRVKRFNPLHSRPFFARANQQRFLDDFSYPFDESLS